MKRKSGSVNLTEGSIWKRLIIFALPLLASSVIQQLYNIVDLIFVGHLLGDASTASQAAVGASSLLVTCLVGFFTGMSVGSSVVVAKAFGRKDSDGLSKAVHTSMMIAIIGGIILTIVGIAISRVCLIAMKTPDEILELAVVYIRIYFLGIIGVVVYNIGSGVLRALGNSSFPMICQIVGGGIHIILDVFFLMVVKNGVVGVAISTSVSQVISAIMIVVYLAKAKDDSKLVVKKLVVNGPLFREILKIGVPAGIQAMVITFSNIFVQSQINGFGVETISAFTAYFKVELVMYLPIVALGQAVTTYVGQNIGAGLHDRVKKGVRQSLIIGIVMTVALSIIVLIFRHAAFSIFSEDAVVISLGMTVAGITFPFYFVYVIMEIFADTIRGSGVSLPPMIIILCSLCIFRVAYLMIAMSIKHVLPLLAAAYPLSWAVAAIGLTLYYFFGKWRNKAAKA